jgi:hypothetical protein
MTPTVLTLSITLLLCGQSPPSKSATPREPNPLAPSLPLLTEEEENKLDEIVERFIQYDTGKLRGEDGKKALKDFQALGPEATFALIRGLNRSAGIEATCPAATIGKKLVGILRTSNDPDLLEFARENVGAGITRSPHMGILKDVRLAATLRKKALASKPATVPAAPPPVAPGSQYSPKK